MTNLFLKVNKDLFKLGLNPTEILLLSQVMEFNTNTGDCFMSDKAFADAFGVSESTISRELKVLEKRGFITRVTKNVRGGKERHITANLTKIEQELTSFNLKPDGGIQASKCSLTNSKLTFDNKQNDLIKDNNKQITEEDNLQNLSPNGDKFINSPKVELEEISVSALLAMGARYEITDNDLIRIIDTGKLFKIKQ